MVNLNHIRFFKFVWRYLVQIVLHTSIPWLLVYYYYWNIEIQMKRNLYNVHTYQCQPQLTSRWLTIIFGVCVCVCLYQILAANYTEKRIDIHSAMWERNGMLGLAKTTFYDGMPRTIFKVGFCVFTVSKNYTISMWMMLAHRKKRNTKMACFATKRRMLLVMSLFHFVVTVTTSFFEKC